MNIRLGQADRMAVGFIGLFGSVLFDDLFTACREFGIANRRRP